MKNLIVIIALLLIMVIIVYYTGSRHESVAPAVTASSTPPVEGVGKTQDTATGPANNNADETTTEHAVDPGAAFSHFRVGPRNVKTMLADGEIVWVGTSGGVIRYDTNNDDYRLFDVKTGLLANGVFHLAGNEGGRMTRKGDLSARYGGEEFAVIAPLTNTFGMKTLAERLRKAIEEEVIEWEGETLQVTASFGAACIAEFTSEEDVAKLIKLADHYLYKAKENGRNRCEVYPKVRFPGA